MDVRRMAAQRGVKLQWLAKHIGLSRSGLYWKLADASRWTAVEKKAIIKILKPLTPRIHDTDTD